MVYILATKSQDFSYVALLGINQGTALKGSLRLLLSSTFNRISGVVVVVVRVEVEVSSSRHTKNRMPQLLSVLFCSDLICLQVDSWQASKLASPTDSVIPYPGVFVTEAEPLWWEGR